MVSRKTAAATEASANRYESYANEPIAIVGTGCRFPGGSNSPSKLWDMLIERRDALRDIDRWNVDGFHHTNGERSGALNVKNAYLLQEDVKTWDAAFFGINVGIFYS